MPFPSDSSALARPTRIARALAGPIAALVSLALALGAGELIARRAIAHEPPTLFSREGALTPFYDGSPHPWSPDSILGWRPTPHARGRLVSWDCSNTIEIDGAGIRRDAEVAPDKGGRFRIALMGDSFTFGHGVDGRDTFAAGLEAALASERPTEALNFGVPSYGAAQSAARLARDGIPLHPDLAIWGYLGSTSFRDCVRYDRAFARKVKRPLFGVRDGRVALTERARNRAILKRGGLLSRSVLYMRFVATRWLDLEERVLTRLGRWQNPEPALTRDAFAILRAGVRTMADAMAAEGGEFLVVYFPRRAEADGTADPTEVRVLEKAAREAGVPFLDLTAAFRQASAAGPSAAGDSAGVAAQPLYFPRDAHWTPGGHAVAARALAEWVRGSSRRWREGIGAPPGAPADSAAASLTAD